MVVVSLQSNQYSPQLCCKMKEIRTLMTWHCCIEVLNWVTSHFVVRHFNRSHFQPLAFSTDCKINHRKLDLFNSVQIYSIFSRRSKTIKVREESIERHQSESRT